MIKLNNEMFKYIISISNYDKELIDKKVKEFSEKVFSTIKMIDECVVIVDHNNEMEQTGLNNDWILSQYGDYSGYEASCNEMRVKDFIDIDIIALQPTPFILRLIDELKILLKKRFPQYNFIIIGLVSRQDIEVRFHMLRDDEAGWLSESIDDFNEAILVATI